MHVLHIKVTGAKNFGRMKEVIAIVEAAQKRGVAVAADQYPYVASSTGLIQTIPPWAHEGGNAKLVARLKDPDTRARIRKEMDDPNPTWENRLVSAGHLAQRPDSVVTVADRAWKPATSASRAGELTTRRRRWAGTRTTSC